MTITYLQLIGIILASGVVGLIAGWALGIFTLKHFIFWRARNSSEKLDPSNFGQLDVIFAQMVSHIDWFFEMVFLTGVQKNILRNNGEEPIKCFPHLGKDLGDYAMTHPPEHGEI